ncbi:MAG TPA: Spy/CpxP family protein refolding chaperone [Coleofasciculaceae cyanobacterium]|jgi:Spy/CpxP family protein refolding chaperone
MKIKLMPMLRGGIALTVVATPLIVQAQANTFEKPLVEQAQAKPQGRFAPLNLTQTQKDDIKKVRQDVRERIKGILTPEQLEKLKAARKNKQGRREAIAAMNLSEKQKADLKTMKKSAKDQIQAILTPNQQRQLEETIQQRRQQQNR